MHRALLVLAAVVPSLAFACGGGQGLGDSWFGALFLLLFVTSPLWMIVGLLFAIGLVARSWNAGPAKGAPARR